ncbi:hypothetical protein CDSM653_00438 [Caldanaerobacter subterraneus subsp. pacificus DSM 12653]|uniref:Uncharacterized protein n=1 Tax=Caldanaerobacter subterraneus subsp. pacificus DSM 12653 TaxID=391606 RepID=A0A0F5PRM5_9THEO|nr:hypothetical protein CDSM653_00438 [Caldanaerobacter subterraneus subsp. pacificus DSM 12653]
MDHGIFFRNFSFYIDRGGNKKVGGENVYEKYSPGIKEGGD